MTTNPVLTDLRERLVRAHEACAELCNDISYESSRRLRGKIQGISLAISYVDEYLRDPLLGTETEDSK